MKIAITSCALLMIGAASIPAAERYVPLVTAIGDMAEVAIPEDAEDIPVAAHEGSGRVLVTDFQFRGLTLLHADGSDPIRITDGTNAGYGASISPDGRYVGYKGFRDSAGARRQAALLYDIQAMEIINLSGWRSRVGTPSVSVVGTIGFTIGKTLHILDAKRAKAQEVDLEGAANLIGFSPDGRRVAYPDNEARIRAVDLAEGKDILLTGGARGFWGPAFSPDGSQLLASTADGDVAVFPSNSAGTVAFLSEAERDPNAILRGARLPAYLRNPIWLDHKTVAMLRVTAEGDSQKGRQFLSFHLGLKPGARIRASAPLPVEVGNVLLGRTSLYRMQGRALDRANLERASEAPAFRWKSMGPALPARMKTPLRTVTLESGGFLIRTPLAKVAAARDSVMIPDVPYLSQTHDTRDGWDGSSSCGATSAIMTLAYYGLLAKHPITIKKSGSHVTDYGFYITEKYTQGTTTFNIGSKDPDGVTGYGGFGYITKNDWADTKGSMAAYLKIHGAKSEVDWSTTLAEVKREIDARHPLVVLNALTTSGHYIAAIGYFKGDLDGTVIFNDPYGNRNHTTYNSYRGGIRVYYDMPGVNNGYANLKNAGCFVYSRAERSVTSMGPLSAPLPIGSGNGAKRVNVLGVKLQTARRTAAGAYFPVAFPKRLAAEAAESAR